jgi:NAD(P)-dependent dehydrogenase (short-subunit alcohol dehydrogenase family)
VARKSAFVTGASRGIGKACAIELARVGYDIAITARTVKEGEPREHSSTLKESDTSPLPGSLNTVADAVRALGREVLVVPADILDRASLGAAVATVLERWGTVDVVIHNARYIGPGHMDRFAETPIELLEKMMEANVFAPLVINKLFLPAMLEAGRGTFINISSAAAYGDPTKPAGEGGWGMGYGMTKAAFHRIAGFINVEYAGTGIRAFNVQPGLIATERIGQDMAKFGIENVGAPPEVVGLVAVWLCTEPEAADLGNDTIEAQYFAHERGLLPSWGGPLPGQGAISYDRSGAALQELELALEPI